MPPASVGQPFGGHWADYSQFGLDGHNGQDFPAPKGTPIFAVADGFIVEQTAKDTGYGLRISQRVDDGKKHYLFVYGHIERLENPVDLPYNWNEKGHAVKRGQVIGYVDSTGFSTGNHLHLGMYEYDQNGNKLNSNNGYGGAIDPMPFIRNKMEIFKILGEETLVVKNLDGKYYPIATGPELYPVVAEVFGFNGNETFLQVERSTVEANFGGYAKATIAFVPK